MVNGEPWVLVAPWYRWPRAGVPSSGRSTRPVFQKFAADRFVNEFLKEPQRSLKFVPEVDEVHEVDFIPAPPLSIGALTGKISSLFPLDKDGNVSPSRTRLRSTGLRKIYLDTHSRHYLVVCELHCDVAGFPSPRAREVCQAGFVVRRRHLSYPAAARAEAGAIVKDMVALDAEIAAHKLGHPQGHKAPKELIGRIRALFRGTGAAPTPELLELKRSELQAKLERWKSAVGAHWALEGWIAGREERIGAWQLVEDEPQDLLENWFPMWPLHADPAKPQHDAAGRSIFFGVLPSASFDTDTSGKARFDDRTTYEVRCFVRRHDARCPRGEAPDCRGPITWSAATERYRLAAQFDLQGTANRPLTIQMPDLAELAAQATQKPLGKFSPVKIIQPQSLMPTVSGAAASGGRMGGAAICFVSIPLVTIVALFVFHIFLPIVVLLFGLWFLLAFKFCIPPQAALGAALEAKLAAAPPEPDADFAVNANLGGGVTEPVTAASLNKDLRAGVAAGFAAAHGFAPGEARSKLARFPDQKDASGVQRTNGLSNAALKDLAEVAREVGGLPKNVHADPPVRGDITAGLEYEPRRVVEKAAA